VTDQARVGGAGNPLPTGTVTFLRTDVEGSMALVRAFGDRWDGINAVHIGLVRDAVTRRGGTVVRTEGDAVFAAFPEAGAAVAAAVDAQRSLAGNSWPDDARLRVRMGLHSGEAHLAGDDYGGIEVNRAARVAAVGHGGQVVLSGPTHALTVDDLPDGVAARELGSFVLKDVPRPERLYQLDIPGLPSEFPPIRAGRATVGNLEPRLTTFVGRERQLDELRALVGDARLVTVTGPGGIGKSSLASETARALESDFPDGAWFVALASIDDPDDVRGLIARTLGLFDGSSSSATETLPRFAAERSMLLVLDNFEHVMDAAPAASELVRASPGSRVIVTSRAPLHLAGEHEFPVAPLALDGLDGAARRLFVERARAVRPGWDPELESAVVDEICRLVDGLPLGIELAAARVSVLPLPAIRDRLAANLKLPGGGSRDAPQRQQTLEATVAWSHDLLTPGLQRRLHRLSVFEGSFDADQAGPITADGEESVTAALDDLVELVDQSLIERDPSNAGIRFRLLRTIQSVAAARLADDGDEQAVRRRHAEAFLALALKAREHEATVDRGEWIDRLAADEPNLRAAVHWAIESDEAVLALELVAALWRFWQVDGHLVEGRELAERAIAMPGAQARTVERMWAVAAAGSIAYWQADSAHARVRYREQLELARALDHEEGLVDGLWNLSSVEFIDNEGTARVRGSLEEVRARYRDLGDERGIARADWAIANVMMDEDRPDEALVVLNESLARFAELGDAQYHAMAAGSLAWVNFMLDNEVAAVRWAIAALRETYEQRDLGTATISLHVGVLIAVITKHFDEAARLTGAFEAGMERYGVRPPAALERFIRSQNPFRLAREALPPERFDAEYETGRRMTIGQAVELLTELARTAD
jgi:predicted ATPase/class 3 adenylate cyclase